MSPERFFWLFLWPWVAMAFLGGSIWAANRYGEVKCLIGLGLLLIVVIGYVAATQVQW